jgi:hypothetical protein
MSHLSCVPLSAFINRTIVHDTRHKCKPKLCLTNGPGSVTLALWAFIAHFDVESTVTVMAQNATHVQESILVAPKVYELPEVGGHIGTITRIEDLGIVHSDAYGDQHKIKIHIRIEDEKTSKDEVIFVFQTCTLSMGAKSRLGTFLRQLGLPIDGALDLADLAGMRINVNIIHNQNGDKTYANVESVSRIRGNKTVATPVVETI